MLGFLIRFLPGGAFIAPTIQAAGRVFVRIAMTLPGMLVIGCLLGWFGHIFQSWNDVPNALRKAAAESRAAADTIDRQTADDLLAKARADTARLIQLRDQDNEEDRQQIEELERKLTAEQRKARLPTDDDAVRLRLK